MPNEKKEKKTPQWEKVLKELEKGPQDSWDLAFRLHMLRVPNRIKEIEKKGYVVDREYYYKDGTHGAIYTLRKDAS